MTGRKVNLSRRDVGIAQGAEDRLDQHGMGRVARGIKEREETKTGSSMDNVMRVCVMTVSVLETRRKL